MGQEYLIDTNIVIDSLGNIIPEKGKVFLSQLFPQISVITYIEALGWHKATQEYLLKLNELLNLIPVLQIDDSVVQKCVQIRQQKKIGLGDALIAATALVYNLTLVTRNTNDFLNIEGLKILNPWEL